MAKKAVFGIVKTVDQAELVVRELGRAGFNNHDISVVFSDQDFTRNFAIEKSTRAPEGAIAGGTLGGLVGLGALLIPGFGPLIAAGPLLAALSGAAVGAAAGGIAGALVGMGIPQIEARQYEGRIRGGSILISVHADDAREVERAKELFKGESVQDVGTTPEPSLQPFVRPSRTPVGPERTPSDPGRTPSGPPRTPSGRSF